MKKKTKTRRDAKEGELYNMSEGHKAKMRVYIMYGYNGPNEYNGPSRWVLRVRCMIRNRLGFRCIAWPDHQSAKLWRRH